MRKMRTSPSVYLDQIRRGTDREGAEFSEQTAPPPFFYESVCVMRPIGWLSPVNAKVIGMNNWPKRTP